MVEAFFAPRSLVMAALGFASGLPYAIANETSTVELAELKVDRTTIGLLGAIGTIYSFKFLWSPVVDARPVPGLAWLGRRRSWLVAMQLALMVLIACLASVAPMSKDAPLGLFAAVLVGIAIFSATQDIVVNAWTVDAFPRRELGIGSAMSVGGYRVALLVGGAAALQLAAAIGSGSGWRVAYLALAGAMGVGLVATLLAREPLGEEPERRGFVAALGAPIEDLVARLGPHLLVVAAMVLLFRLPDQLGNTMQKPLLLDTLGYAKEQYGYVRNGVGLVATIAGSLAGGAAVARIGVGKALAVGAILQAASNLGFAWLATTVSPLGATVQPWASWPIAALLAVGSLENLCGGFVATIFVSWLMTLCARRHAATQYALLSGGMAFTGGIATALSGYLSARATWPAYFTWTAVAGLPGLLLVPLAARALSAARTPGAEEDR